MTPRQMIFVLIAVKKARLKACERRSEEFYLHEAYLLKAEIEAMEYYIKYPEEMGVLYLND